MTDDYDCSECALRMHVVSPEKEEIETRVDAWIEDSESKKLALIAGACLITVSLLLLTVGVLGLVLA